MPNKSYTLITNFDIATLCHTIDDDYGLIRQAALIIGDGLIKWVGKATQLPSQYSQLPRLELQGKLITPALIDCHTHLVYGGSRFKEFEQRLNGISYQQIAAQGGGILATVEQTRAASQAQLCEQALARLDQMLSQGVNTVEIKSGYGLNLETELKMLRVAKSLAKQRKVRIKTSLLAAHAIPVEYTNNAEGYLDLVIDSILPQAAELGLIDAVDGFCESIAFSATQLERLFKVAENLNLPVKLHAEQLSNIGGSEMAARFNALSCDHLEYLDAAGVDAMKKAGSVAVLLPGAFYTLNETQKPPIDLFRHTKVPMAIATDANPGSSPLTSLLLAMNMACTLFKMTPQEALAGATVNAARALGIHDRLGQIKVGYSADLAFWNIEHPAQLSYEIGGNPLTHRMFAGEII